MRSEEQQAKDIAGAGWSGGPRLLPGVGGCRQVMATLAGRGPIVSRTPHLGPTCVVTQAHLVRSSTGIGLVRRHRN